MPGEREICRAQAPVFVLHAAEARARELRTLYGARAPAGESFDVCWPVRAGRGASGLQDAVADVEIDVTYSTLNYKDAMIVKGMPGVTRQFPIVPGMSRLVLGDCRRASCCALKMLNTSVPCTCAQLRLPVLGHCRRTLSVSANQ